MPLNSQNPSIISSQSLLQKDSSLGSNYFLAIYKKNNGISDIMIPIIQELTVKFSGKINVFIIDYGDSFEIRKKYSIEIIPAFLLFIDNELVEIASGLCSFKDIEDLIGLHLKAI